MRLFLAHSALQKVVEQRLSAHAEGVFDQPQEGLLLRRVGPGAHAQLDHLGVHVRLGHKAVRRHAEEALHLRAVGAVDGQGAVRLFPGLRDDAVHGLLLQHDAHALDGQPALEQAEEHGGRDGIGQVRRHEEVLVPERLLRQRRKVDLERVALDDADVPASLERRLQHGDEPLVDLDGQDLLCAAGQGNGQAPGARADLQHARAVRLRAVRDARKDLVVRKEVLPERVREPKAARPKKGQDFAGCHGTRHSSM